MTRRAQVWLVVVVLFLVVNLGGAVVAGMQGEVPHAGVHALLALLGAYVLWRLASASRRAGHRAGHWEGAEIPAASSDLTDRLTHLEQAVDTVAIEVERVGEGQRFMTRLFTEHGTSPAGADDASAPVEVQPQEATHVRRP